MTTTFWEKSGGHLDLDQRGNPGSLFVEATEVQGVK